MNPRDIRNTEVSELIVDLFGQLAVLFQDESVIGGRNQQDFGHPEFNQVMHAGKTSLQVGKSCHHASTTLFHQLNSQ